MKVFLSWSKPKSKELATATKEFLEGLFRGTITVWMSSESISYGSMSILDINVALKGSEKCIAFITEENINSPWIMYEVGSIAGKQYLESEMNIGNAVVPIVFDNLDSKYFISHPLNQFQRMTFCKEDMYKLVKQLNAKTNAFPDDITLEKQFNLNWTGLNKSIKNILQSYSLKGRAPITCDFLIDAFEKANFPVPDCGPIVKYDTGFETQKLYDVLLKNVDKRFWIFGRKNRKLFSTENRQFFQDLSRRQKNGFDFRCLFIDPNSDTVSKAQRGANFEDKLMVCLKEAQEVLASNGISAKDVCKLYSCERTDEIIVVDNAIVYSHITYAPDEFPHPLTQSPFFILDIENPIGRKYYQNFENVWKNSKEFIV